MITFIILISLSHSLRRVWNIFSVIELEDTADDFHDGYILFLVSIILYQIYFVLSLSLLVEKEKLSTVIILLILIELLNHSICTCLLHNVALNKENATS